MSISILLAAALALQAPAGPPKACGAPAELLADRTGIEWTFPFESALERAKRENRILMVKPIAFGTTRDGGW